MPAIRLVGRPTGISGYLGGLKQPCLRFEVAPGREIPAERLQLADSWVRGRFAGMAPAPDALESSDTRVRHLLAWTRLILTSRGHHPVLEEAKLREPKAAQQPVWMVLQPCLDFNACLAAVELGIAAMNRALESGEDAKALHEAFDQTLKERAGELDKGRLGGFNTVHFLEDAHALDLPWRRLSGNVFQIGIGAASRWLDSSATDRTGTISMVLARDKRRAAELLREAGLPVPPHKAVTSADEAAAAAEQLTYPVVVKPADKDGGKGVAAFLQDAVAVRKAYATAAEHSKRVIVEKYIHGNDYRLQIVDGEVQGVLERSPGGVVGDGERSIRELVERENLERKTATDDRRYLHPIVPDEEAEVLLAAAAMGWDTVPAEGRFVRLRGASNVAGGGIPRPVPIEEVHPDNLALALRAVRILRLDVAGVDLLMPDIRESWIRTGAGICEVNAKPQMFTTFHAPMLRRIMNGGPGRESGAGNGRVPVAIVLSCAPGETVSALLHERLCRTSPVAGLASAREVRLGADLVLGKNHGSFAASRALMLDPTLQALVISVGDKQVFSRGWPVDRCDALLLVGGESKAASSAAREQFLQLCAMARTLQPGRLFVDAGDPDCVAAAEASGWPSCCMLGDAQAMVDAVVEWLLR